MDAITAVAAAKSDLVGEPCRNYSIHHRNRLARLPRVSQKSTSSNSTMDKATAVAAATIANVLEEGDVLAAVAAGDVSQVPAPSVVVAESLQPRSCPSGSLFKTFSAAPGPPFPLFSFRFSTLFVCVTASCHPPPTMMLQLAFPHSQAWLRQLLPINAPNYACGRRMFLAALMVASKYLQDKNYSNQAWSKIAGLPLEEVNRNERKFLESIGYDLYVNQKTFAVWSSALIAKTSSL
ncbi:hypothetical protein BC829DRAFT_389553, partial [Chytridium lagenaria]